MSLLPLLYSSWWEGLDRPHRLHDQDFGMGIRPELLLTPRQLMDRYYIPLRSRDTTELYYKPLLDPLRKEVGGFSTITDDKDVFKVLIDVRLFKPEEITVKLVDKFVVVEAKHKEKQDEHGLVSRQFVRKYLLPDVVDTDLIKTELSADGILVIQAPVKDIKKDKVEKIINIERTGKTLLGNRMTDETQNIPIGTDRYKDKVSDTTETDKELTTVTTTGTTDTSKKLETEKDSEKIMEDKRELERMIEDRKKESMKMTDEKKMEYENLMEEKKKDEKIENKFKLDEKRRDERKKC